MDELHDTSPVAASKNLEILGLSFVLGVALLLYRGAFQGFFVQDDFAWLVISRFHSFKEYLDCFFRFNPMLGYRPLSDETLFWAGQKIFGLRPLGFHLISVALHLLASALVYRLLRMFLPPLPSLAGTLFFSTHNAHFSSVYWISAVPEPMALVFYLTAVILFIRFDREDRRGLLLLSLLAMGFGVLSKESILSLPLVLAAYCLIFSPRRLLWCTPFFCLSGTCALIRMTSQTVKAAPYPVTLGREALGNLLTYFSWSAGFSEAFLKLKLEWNHVSAYPWIGALFTILVVLLLLASKNKRVGFFALAWYLLALQPVLYFSNHIFPYYLAPSLPGLALLVALSLPRFRALRDWKGWVPMLALVVLSVGISKASIDREGEWFNERSYIPRDVLSKMPEVDRQLPKDHIAFLVGFQQSDLGAMLEDVSLRAFGFPASRFIVVDFKDSTRREIELLEETRKIRDCYCFLYKRPEIINVTDEFRIDPDRFLQIAYPGQVSQSHNAPKFLDRPEVRLELNSEVLVAGKDRLSLRVVNLKVRVIDLLYTIDGGDLKAVFDWQLDENQADSLPVDKWTPRGLYEFKAIRDADCGSGKWIRVDARTRVK
jgi:hypothetical protein